MVNILKKNITIALIVLFIVFAFVISYLLFIQLPYAGNQDDLVNARNEILQENGYVYKDYYNKHLIAGTYYILYVNDNGQDKYVVYDKDKNFVSEYSDEVFDKNQILIFFTDKYQKETQNIEVGYIEDHVVYVVTYQGDNELIYAYYRIDTGEFIKGNQL